MTHPYAFPLAQSVAMPSYAPPNFPSPQPVAAPPAPLTSPSVCLHVAEGITPNLSTAQLGLLHYIAFVLLSTPGVVYRPHSPQAGQMLPALVQQQLLVAHGDGYILANLGHAVLSHFEAQAIH